MGSVLFLDFRLAQAGCAGDCFKCHEKLRNNELHVSLGTCINCHNDTTKMNRIITTPQENGCGNNCFQCHKQWPKNGYHASLEFCNKCHKG
ncbi:MAG: hypothetical protein N3C60_02755 [Calditerrivibrio sp.]|nr:hypothetical protein [Calditerrivibrio sp.]